MARTLLTFAVTAVMLAGTIAFTITPVSAEMGPETGPVPERPSSERPATTSSLPDTGESTTVDGSAATTANLNLRRSPSLSAAIQTVIPVGSVVEITGEAEDGFYPVTYGSVTGFAHGDYLAIGDEATGPTGSTTTDTTADTGAGSGGSDIVQIIYNAAAMYGQNGDDLLRVATCESGLNPYAVNGSSNASGLFQFLPSTWATTPYADQDIFDPVANAEAAAWMWANGRRGEWVCQ